MTSPALTLTLMIAGWFAMAVAMLWGMLRIARRHAQHHAADMPPESTVVTGEQAADSRNVQTNAHRDRPRLRRLAHSH